MKEAPYTVVTHFKDQRNWWQRLRNKIPPFPARAVYVELTFNTGQGWRGASVSADAPEGVGRLELTFRTFYNGEEFNSFDDIAIGD